MEARANVPHRVMRSPSHPVHANEAVHTCSGKFRVSCRGCTLGHHRSEPHAAWFCMNVDILTEN